MPNTEVVFSADLNKLHRFYQFLNTQKAFLDYTT